MEFTKEFLNHLSSARHFDAPAFVQAHQQDAALSLRLNPKKSVGSYTFPMEEAVPWCSNAYYLESRPSFTLDPLFHAGAYYVQEASSMFLEYVLKSTVDLSRDLRVLDLCAAPGGKSTLIASLLSENSLLLSNDVIRSRAGILEENMTRWGHTNTWVSSNDPGQIGKLQSYFDVIIVDAPCSGSGLFRKDADAFKEWSLDNVNLCAQRQQRILADIFPALKEGGILIYATCSYSPQEDEEVLDKIAGMFAVESLSVTYNETWGIAETISDRKAMKGYRFYPDKVKGEGFFIAAMRKTGEQKRLKEPRLNLRQNNASIKSQCSYLLKSNWDWQLLAAANNSYHAIAQAHEKDFALLGSLLYLRKFGVKLGSPSAKEWLPDHEIAQCTDKSGDLKTLDLSLEQALYFLKKENIDIPATGKAWYLVNYKGLCLGWIKALSNRINNYLPAHLRIRMDISKMIREL